MTRFMTLFFTVIVFAACEKVESNLGTDFQRFVGKWENIEGDDKSHIQFFKNGKIIISKSTERGKRFLITEVTKLPGGLVNGVLWNSFHCNSKRTGEGITVNINNLSDTCIFNLGTIVTDFVANEGSRFYIKVK